MPSPFPGMDPYLEGSLWASFHSQFSPEIARQLGPKLHPKYVALTTERYVVDVDEGIKVTTADIYPDVAVARPRRTDSLQAASTSLAEPPLRLATVVPARYPVVNVQIRSSANRELVTSIEVFSPSNKRSPGRRKYLAKRHRLLLTTAHLLEIDLLRRGQRVPMREPLPDYPYFVFLTREQRRSLSDVWPIGLRDRLPVVPVPLLEEDADVDLDLQAALEQVYDTVRYDLIIDYSRPPDIPLTPNDQAWAAQIVRS